MADAKAWAKRVAEWRASGRKAEEFAAGRGFTASTLRWWASRLGRRDAAFVRVERSAERPAARAGVIELEVGAVRVVVREGFDRSLLIAVLGVLRASTT